MGNGGRKPKSQSMKTLLTWWKNKEKNWIRSIDKKLPNFVQTKNKNQKIELDLQTPRGGLRKS